MSSAILLNCVDILSTLPDSLADHSINSDTASEEKGRSPSFLAKPATKQAICLSVSRPRHIYIKIGLDLEKFLVLGIVDHKEMVEVPRPDHNHLEIHGDRLGA